MAQSIGLHVDTPPPRKGLAISSETERELRRRTWYSMYVLDRLLALQLGRPMAIHQADFNVTLPSRAENDDSFGPGEHLSTPGTNDTRSEPSTMDYFLHVIHFSSIVEHVIRELYQLIQPEISADKLLSDASIIDTSLLGWRSSLPHHLRFDLGHTFEKSVVFQRQVTMILFSILKLCFFCLLHSAKHARRQILPSTGPGSSSISCSPRATTS